ncbi:hypothetical protein SDC9_165698 [bioreactor metagenome]|uniref:Uncharacterized protein n=1 Tax=bioreactor metagenome TaxID=1076179 RepID=A0A645FUZ1_9ZZZZ
MENELQLSPKHIKQIIDETIKYTTEAVVAELKKARMLKSLDKTSFQRTEQLLYNYKNFQKAIDDKWEQIEMIQQAGIKKKSKDITSWTSGSKYSDVKTDMEQAEDQIRKLEAIIEKTTEYVEKIDWALEKIKNDPYFPLIRMKYIEGKSRENIAEYLNCDESTITRNKNRLINVIKIYLFSDDAMLEMVGCIA